MASKKSKKGSNKERLRALSTAFPSEDEVDALLKAHFVPAESPIIIAILGQTLLEIELDTLLRTHFSRRDDEMWKQLTSEYGPLSTFKRKITAGYAFGIYDKIIRDGLNTVRDIRNAFAHSHRPIDFSHDYIRTELKTITLPDKQESQLYKWLTDVPYLADKDPTSKSEQMPPQIAFKDLCFILMTVLLKKQTRRLKTKQRRSKTWYQTELAQALLRDQPNTLAAEIPQILGIQPANPIHSLQRSVFRKLGRSRTILDDNEGKS